MHSSSQTLGILDLHFGATVAHTHSKVPGNVSDYDYYCLHMSKAQNTMRR